MIQKRITTQMELIGIPVLEAAAETNHNQFPVVEIGATAGGHETLVPFLGKNTCLQ